MWRPHITFTSIPYPVVEGRVLAGTILHPTMGELVVASLYAPSEGSSAISGQQQQFLHQTFDLLRSWGKPFLVGGDFNLLPHLVAAETRAHCPVATVVTTDGPTCLTRAEEAKAIMAPIEVLNSFKK